MCYLNKFPKTFSICLYVIHAQIDQVYQSHQLSTIWTRTGKDIDNCKTLLIFYKKKQIFVFFYIKSEGGATITWGQPLHSLG